MHCLPVPREFLLDPASALLPAPAAHHLRDVLRVRPGDPVRLVDGAGTARDARVASAARSGVVLEPCGEPVREPPPPARITLYQCVAKPARMDWLLEKAVETGVSRVVPVVSSRVVSRVRPGETPDRWRRVLGAALCQCGSAWGTELAPAASWPEALRAMGAAPGPLFVGALAPGALPVGDALLARREELRALPVAWAIGPEGDFSPEELSDLLALPSAVPVSFGPRILRVETAALYAVSATLALA